MTFDFFTKPSVVVGDVLSRSQRDSWLFLSAKKLKTAADLPAVSGDVFNTRNRVFDDLAGAGFNVFVSSDEAGSRRYNYALRCMPNGISAFGAAHHCLLKAICPFCWARQVVTPVFSRMENRLSALGAKRKDAVLLYFSYELDAVVNSVTDALDYVVTAARDRTLRNREHRKFKPDIGSMVLLAHDLRPDNRIVISRQVMLLFSSDAALAGDKLARVPDFRIFRDITQEQLRSILRPALKFPDGLWRIPAGDAVQFMHNLPRIRQLSFFGNLASRVAGRNVEIDFEQDEIDMKNTSSVFSKVIDAADELEKTISNDVSPELFNKAKSFFNHALTVARRTREQVNEDKRATNTQLDNLRKLQKGVIKWIKGNRN